MGAVLLDSNLLLLLLVGDTDTELVVRFKRTQGFLPSDYDLLRDVVRPWVTLVSTPHILAETSNLLGSLTGDLLMQARNRMADRVVTIDERPCAAVDALGEPTFLRLGLTDAAICRLANDHRLKVVTGDFDLWVHLAERIKDRAVNFNHYRMR